MNRKHILACAYVLLLSAYAQAQDTLATHITYDLTAAIRTTA